VGNAKPIIEEARKILLAKKNEKCNDMTIHRKMDEMDQLLGLLDSAYAYLYIFYPTDSEKECAKEAVSALVKCWRKIILSMTLKAHIIECHKSKFNDKWGIGDKEASLQQSLHKVD